MEQVSQIIPADNSSDDVSQTVQTQESLVHSEAVAIRTNWKGKAHINKYVSNSSKKTTDNKATRLERQRERKRELRKDPAYAERERKRQRERKRERYQTDPDYAERERKRKRGRKKQHCQSVNSAETTQSSSKNSEGTAPPLFSRQAEGIFTVPIDPSQP